MRKMKQDASMLKSHVQIYQKDMAERKRLREFMQFIIKKYKIDISEDAIQRQGHEKHLDKCDYDDHAYFTHKYNKFFDKDDKSQRDSKEATAVIARIVSEVEMQEELMVLGKFIQLLLPMKMQRVFLTKCKALLNVDYEDPSNYIYDSNLAKKVCLNENDDSPVKKDKSPMPGLRR